MDIVNFGTRLKEIRAERNISQDELGKLLNTTKQVISRYERGERTPRITVAAEYAKKLDIDLAYLLGADTQKNPAAKEGNGLTEEALEFMKRWQQIPEESQEMVYRMIDAALKSRGL